MNLVQEVMDYISGYDPEVGKGLELELGTPEKESGADRVGEYCKSGSDGHYGDCAD